MRNLMIEILIIFFIKYNIMKYFAFLGRLLISIHLIIDGIFFFE